MCSSVLIKYSVIKFLNVVFIERVLILNNFQTFENFVLIELSTTGSLMNVLIGKFTIIVFIIKGLSNF